MAQLVNEASVSGNYNGLPFTDTTQAVVDLSAVSIVKEADKQLWIYDDELTYTIVVRNTDESEPGLPVSDMTVVDMIEPAIARLVDGSLTVVIGTEPVATVDFTYENGLLTVRLGEIPAGVSATITFRVEKVQ